MSELISNSEFSFSGADFELVRRLIYERAGINLHASKKTMVYSRLSRRLRELGHTSAGEYLKQLEQVSGEQGKREWQEFINCLTTNLTAFFREDHHFPLLAAELNRSKGRKTRIWCNAASTGEEPYSIAMTVRETLGPSAPVQILCSDIDTKVLEKAERAVYPIDSRGLTSQLRKAYFMRGTGKNQGFMRIKPALRSLVEFRAFNLMDARWSLGEPFDVVFCRNVMIYFDAPTQRRVLANIHQAMQPNGLLFAGHSEHFAESRDLFRLRGKTIYERV